jgi:hypothetical protein
MDFKGLDIVKCVFARAGRRKLPGWRVSLCRVGA